MKMDGVHIFIILMLALMCSSCLGSFMREGFSNDNDPNDPNAADQAQNGNKKSDKFVRNPVGETYQDGYSEMYRDLDRETIDYSNSQLAKGKKIGPHRSKEDYNDDDNDNQDNDDNNINSYGNVNKYPNVENDKILMAGGSGSGGRGGGTRGRGGVGVFQNYVSSSQIPPGDEDLYILKSQVIPPVCPACPAVTTCPSSEKQKCPPCPPCARCPEPAFECKKVPNYSGQNDSYLPQPVMSDFSQFGL
jgi:hypothetical protein